MATTTLDGAIGHTLIRTNLSGDIDISTTSFDIVDASSFPIPSFVVLLDAEMILVTEVATNTFTVTRGYGGTTAARHYEGVIVETLDSFDVVDASSFPSPKFRIRVESEIMLVVDVSSNTFIVARGNVGTTTASHANGTTLDYVASMDIGPGNTEGM